MDILVVMCIGILVGKFIFPQKAKKFNEYLAVCCTFLLIFSMGVMLGQKDNFIEEIAELGISSFLFFLIPTICSIVLVYLFTKRFMESKKAKKRRKELEK